MRIFVPFSGFLLAIALAAPPAAGEMYRCVAPDGSTSYTSRPDACPDAELHQPRGQVQSVPSSRRVRGNPARRSRPAPAPAKARPASVRTEAAQAAAWRAKRTAAEEEKARLDHNVEAFRRIVTGCNRGSDWWMKDETGIKRRYTCEEARKKHEELRDRHAELARYLSTGLAEECRRAGCLPGWIR